MAPENFTVNSTVMTEKLKLAVHHLEMLRQHLDALSVSDG